MLKITSEQQFDQFLADHGRVIVKFYTTWCVDCRRTENAWADYAEGNSERAAFADLNSEEVLSVAERFDVRGIPSFLVFEGGQLVDRLYSRDAKTAKQVVDFADRVLAESVKP